MDTQLRHHGYSGKWTKALKYRNPTFKSPAFSLAHCLCMLDYHLLLVTKFRAPLFDEAMAPRLFDYVMAVGRKHGFAVDRMSLLPDHMHLLLQGIPGESGAGMLKSPSASALGKSDKTGTRTICFCCSDRIVISETCQSKDARREERFRYTSLESFSQLYINCPEFPIGGDVEKLFAVAPPAPLVLRRCSSERQTGCHRAT